MSSLNWFNTVFQSSDVYESLDIRLYLGPYWDMYLTTLLSVVVGFILLLRHRAWDSNLCVWPSISGVDWTFSFSHCTVS